jgi:hypothetical protein
LPELRNERQAWQHAVAAPIRFRRPKFRQRLSLLVPAYTSSASRDG